MESFSVFPSAGGSLARARARLIPFFSCTAQHSTGRTQEIERRRQYGCQLQLVYTRRGEYSTGVPPVQFTLISRVIGRPGRYVRSVGTTLASSAHGPLELYVYHARRPSPACRTDQYSYYYYYCTIYMHETTRRSRAAERRAPHR